MGEGFRNAWSFGLLPHPASRSGRLRNMAVEGARLAPHASIENTNFWI